MTSFAVAFDVGIQLVDALLLGDRDPPGQDEGNEDGRQK